MNTRQRLFGGTVLTSGNAPSGRNGGALRPDHGDTCKPFPIRSETRPRKRRPRCGVCWRMAHLTDRNGANGLAGCSIQTPRNHGHRGGTPTTSARPFHISTYGISVREPTGVYLSFPQLLSHSLSASGDFQGERGVDVVEGATATTGRTRGVDAGDSTRSQPPRPNADGVGGGADRFLPRRGS